MGQIRSVRFSPDGRFLASGGDDDDTVRLWDVRTGQCVSTRRPDRPYKRTNIHDISGLTPAQITVLKELGAVE